MATLFVRMGVLLAVIAGIQWFVSWRNNRDESVAAVLQGEAAAECTESLVVEMTRPSDDMFDSRPALGLSLVALVVGITIHKPSVRETLCVAAVVLAGVDIISHCVNAWYMKR